MTAQNSDPRPGGAEGRTQAHVGAGASTTIAPAPAAEQAALDDLPAAFASAYAPAPGRSMWAAVYRCPRCGHHHLARGRAIEALAGLRRARCGRRVWIIISRKYRGGGGQ